MLGSLGAQLGRAGREAARGAAFGHASAMAGALSAWRPRPGHAPIMSSTWRVTNGAWWATFLGLFLADLANGPKTKFDLLLMLSNFD